MTSISAGVLFDMLTPGPVSLPMAVMTAHNAGLKSSGDMDAFSYFDCEENNPGTLRGQSWQRSGPLLATTKVIAEAWNAAVQRSPLSQREKDLLLFSHQDARRVCGIVSKIARVNPERAARELHGGVQQVLVGQRAVPAFRSHGDDVDGGAGGHLEHVRLLQRAGAKD